MTVYLRFCRTCNRNHFTDETCAAGRTYCTEGRANGEHDASCMPPANPNDPELRLMRAIFGLCPECDNTEQHEHKEV